jgi:hypothetical protein
MAYIRRIQFEHKLLAGEIVSQLGQALGEGQKLTRAEQNRKTLLAMGAPIG